MRVPVGLALVTCLVVLLPACGSDDLGPDPGPSQSTVTSARGDGNATTMGSRRPPRRPTRTTRVARPTRTTRTTRAVPPTTRTTRVLPPPPPAGGVDIAGVVDGDTFDAVVDGRSERVRLIGINTPESGECLADTATAALRTLLTRVGPVALSRDRTDRDQYGRLLRYVRAGDVFVNGELVRLGLALSRAYAPDTARQGELDAAQAEAQAARRGLWAPDACGPATAADLAVETIVADPPGDDTANPNAEYVVIRNRGGDLALSGWTVRDESASHRFAFPNGFVLRGGAAVTLHTGCGPDSAEHLYWCQSNSTIWNNDGDTVFVVDPNGNVVVSRGY